MPVLPGGLGGGFGLGGDPLLGTVKIETHVADALSRLVEQLKDKTKVRALVSALSAPSQDLEDALWQLLTERTIDDAIGAQLDALGKIVGEPRDGALDEDYRSFIRARIRTNRSDGQRETLLQILRLLLPGVAFDVHQYAPATIEFTPQSPITLDPYKMVSSFLGRAVSAGVQLFLVWTQESLENTLTFASTYGLGTLLTQMPGSAHATPTRGGVFAGVVPAQY